MDNSEKGKLSIELNDEVALGIYSNLAIISHSYSEFVVDFLRMLPGVPKSTVLSRIILTPDNAKRLMLALQDNIAKYESVNGYIKIDSSNRDNNLDNGSFFPPFNVPKGNA